MTGSNRALIINVCSASYATNGNRNIFYWRNGLSLYMQTWDAEEMVQFIKARINQTLAKSIKEEYYGGVLVIQNKIKI